MDDIKSISGPYYELTLELKRRLEKLPYVDAFWIHGSRAVGRGTADSDIDYTVLVTDAKSQEPKLMSLLSDLIEWDEIPGFSAAFGIAAFAAVVVAAKVLGKLFLQKNQGLSGLCDQ